MPRGDGTGPMGTGPMGRSRKNVQRCQGNMSGFSGINSAKQDSLEEQATRLEEQAANLRKLAKKKS